MGSPLTAAAEQFQARRSGLFVPASSAPWPIDLIQSFATGTELLGQPMPPDDVVVLVRRRSVAQTLAFCGYWLAAIEAADDDVAIDREYVEKYFVQFDDADIAPRARRLIRQGSRILIPQALLLLAKLALLISPGEPPADHPDTDMPLVGALVGMSDYLDGRGKHRLAAAGSPWGSVPADLSLELVANQYFNSGYDDKSLLARFRRIYLQLMPELAAQEPQRYLDFDREFLQTTGLPLRNVIIVALTAWAFATRRLPLVGLNAFEGLLLPADEIKAVLDLLSTDRAAAVAKVTKDENEFGFAWTFSVFSRHPLFRLGDDTYIVVSPRLLADRVLGGLIYWDVAGWDGTHLNTQRGNKLRNLVADAVEAYVGEVLRAIAPSAGGQPRVYSEQDLLKAFSISKKGGQKVCDFVVDYGDAFVLVEVNSHRLTRASAVGGSTTAVDHDLEMLIFKRKAKQFEATIKALREGESRLTGRPAPASRRYHPVLVTDDQFPNSPVTHSRIQERLATEGFLQGAGITQLEVLSLEDVDLLEGIAESGGPTMADILARKAQGNLRSMDLASFVRREAQIAVRYSDRVSRQSSELLAETLGAVRLPEDRLLDGEPEAPNTI
ncbi:hypothetical protein ACG83_08510 [Frankia sp. R43]|uniref:hypothetical protein n=1 Tax=Frankia sp. R43 TaxID=269536 RepID=UPI0006CA49F5|nr:hypothetical protein [Frankia sp. R43]KPM55409.1 hypothetical protein ACG83_08510 [Frankia sp. R43]